MRFAFSTSPQMCTWPELLAVWQAADQVELFEAGWTFDHFEPILGNPRDGDCLEGWMTLAALLHSTTRLRGGVLVTGMVYRNPAVLANMAATLDITSGGRLELGLGAGWNTDECNAYGIDLGTIRERCDRFAEGLEVVRLLLNQPQSSFSGEHFQLNDAYCNPKPMQAHLPICIGGSGEKRTLPLVAKYADHWNFGTAAKDPIAELRRKREVLEMHCAAIGRDPAEITISALLRATKPLSVEETAELAHRYAEEGVGVGILSMPRPLNPSDVERYAAALEPLSTALA